MMNKKKILFIVPNFSTGGTNRSLQCLLNKLDTRMYDAHVFVMAHDGLYRNDFQNFNILDSNALLESIVAHYESRTGWKKLYSLVTKILCKATKYKFQRLTFKVVANKLIVNNNYDAIIAFEEGVATEFVNAFRHPNKIAWIHCDYASRKSLNNDIDERDIYSSFKSVVCVSKYTRQSFLSIYPKFEKKTFAIYNVLDTDMMHQMAKVKSPIVFNKSLFNIISIGRIDPVKQFSSIPEIASKIKDKGAKFCWYIIGPKGTDDEFQKLQENLIKYDVNEEVKLLGETNNPYNYIEQAQLLVNTSKSEACPYVINEAKVLRTPVVCTNFGSAQEFVHFGENGYYAPLEELDNYIFKLIDDKKVYTTIENNLHSFEFDNQEIMFSIYELIE